jgi:3-hydroxybutyryl-CoA dehydrogenase
VSAQNGYLSPGVAGSGTIATGLAAAASALGEVRLLARSDASAWRAEESVEKLCRKLEVANVANVRITTERADLAGCDLIVEAIIEDLQLKGDLLRELGEGSPDADLASTTSSLSIHELREMSGHAERLFGLHVFNPVPKMELVELCLPDGLRNGVRERAHAFCEALGKTAVEVPDQAGFVVNRLLFPYLFDAVRLLARTGMKPAEVDACMSLGAGHPMGPLRLLDFVGLDVAAAIGQELHMESGDHAHEAPSYLKQLLAEGKLGKKSGEGFYTY